MTAVPGSGAWDGSHEFKHSVVAVVAAAASGNAMAVPGAKLFLHSGDGHPAFGAAYCLAFDTVDPAELDARSGLPIRTLQLIGGALKPCWNLEFLRSHSDFYVTPVARNCFADALDAIRPGADLAALHGRYLVALLRDVGGLLPPPDGAPDAPLPRSIGRVLQLHFDAQAGDAAGDERWTTVRQEAMTAAGTVTTPVGRAVAEFVEAAAWPIDGFVDELPFLVEQLHEGLVTAERESAYTDDIRAVVDRYRRADAAVWDEAYARPTRDGAWIRARLAEDPDIQAYNAPEFQERLFALACAACDKHGTRAYRLLMETLKQL